MDWGGCRRGVVPSTCCYPCSNLAFAESGPANDNSTLSVGRLAESLDHQGRVASEVLSNMHEVEGVPCKLSGAVVGGEKTSCSMTGLSRSPRDTPTAPPPVIESMLRAYTSQERLTGVRRG